MVNLSPCGTPWPLWLTLALVVSVVPDAELASDHHH